MIMDLMNSRRWLETTSVVDNKEDCLVIGMSCSGNSVNVSVSPGK